MNPLLDNYQFSVNERIEFEKSASKLIKYVGDLFYEKNVEIVLFRQPLLDQKSSEILQAHSHATVMASEPITIQDTLSIAKSISNSSITNATIDIGKLSLEWKREAGVFLERKNFINSKLIDFKNSNDKNPQPRDVILYGFGRIGRLTARELITQEGRGNQLRLRAIVIRGELNSVNLEKRASNLRVDSIHGHFPGTVEVDHERSKLIINGRPIHVISTNSGELINYENFGINDALLIDNTGVLRDKKNLSKYLLSKGVQKVLLTAPGKDIPNIVYGVNQENVLSGDKIFSAASCTTNAIVPVLKILNDNYEIKKGHIETIHAYTNDQNLVDNMHSKYRRGRAAAMNMVITETGAGKAVDKAIPGLGKKITSNAIRVPVANGSLAILNLQFAEKTTIQEINGTLKKAAFAGSLVEQIKYSISQELVSSDIIGDSCCSIFDSQATLLHDDKKTAILYVWYDNEYGYTKQVMRLAKHIVGVRRKSYF
ncbi:MAG: glyceraldehyde-3-phosphate dehydrogenase [Schleiferiaceae bacterium]